MGRFSLCSVRPTSLSFFLNTLLVSGGKKAAARGPCPAEVGTTALWKVPEQPCSCCPTWINYSRHVDSLRLTGSPRVPHLFLTFKGRPSHSPGPSDLDPTCQQGPSSVPRGSSGLNMGQSRLFIVPNNTPQWAGLLGIFWVECKVLLQWAACFYRRGAFFLE